METARVHSRAGMAATGSGLRKAIQVIRDNSDRLPGGNPSGVLHRDSLRMPNGDPVPLTLWGADESQGQGRP